MRKRLTITIDEEIYDRLHAVAGQRSISRFIEETLRPHLVEADLEAAYKEMAQDEEREKDALEWAEATIGDVANETR